MISQPEKIEETLDIELKKENQNLDKNKEDNVNIDNINIGNNNEKEKEFNQPDIDWIFDEQYQQNTEFKVNKMKFTEPETIKKLYKIMRIIDEICQSNNFLYWSAFGTTLGCIRHGGIIPWDDDLDLCIKKEDCEIFESSIKPQLQKQGLGVSKIDFGYKIFIEEGCQTVSQKFLDGESYKFPFCDIFVMEKKKKKWQIADKGSQKTNSSEIYRDIQIRQMKRKPFANFEINVPDFIEEYLEKSYSENWKTEAKTHFWDHINQECMKPEVFQLTEELLKPALPFE